MKKLLCCLLVLSSISSSYARTYAFTSQSINSESKKELIRVALQGIDLVETAETKQADFLVSIFKLDNSFHKCNDFKKQRGFAIYNVKTGNESVVYQCSWKSLADSISDDLQLPI